MHVRRKSLRAKWDYICAAHVQARHFSKIVRVTGRINTHPRLIHWGLAAHTGEDKGGLHSPRKFLDWPIIGAYCKGTVTRGRLNETVNQHRCMRCLLLSGQGLISRHGSIYGRIYKGTFINSWCLPVHRQHCILCKAMLFYPLPRAPGHSTANASKSSDRYEILWSTA